MSAWKFYLVTFGCKVNQYETQSLREAWLAQGGEECSAPAEADVVCVNSCAITSKGERDARNAVFRLRREAPSSRLILTGCAARLFADYKPRPGAIWAAPDLLVPQEEKSRLLHGPWADLDGEGVAPSAGMPDATTPPPTVAASTPAQAEAQASKQAFPPFQISAFKRARPVLKVQDGCAHRCTYCIVPSTRGKPRSRPVDEIVSEARRLLQAGHAEIMVSGINLGQYGRGTDTGDFWNLLRTLDAALAPEFAGQARLRISSLEPGQLDQHGLDALLACRMLCPHLHISLQHGSQAVLKRMGRGHYTPAMLEHAVSALASHWPIMGLGADIIAGFPGETEDDMRQLLELIDRLPMSYAHVFPYSRRPGTAADRFDGQIPHSLKLERAARLREAVGRKQQAFLAEQLKLPRMLVAADNPQAFADSATDAAPMPESAGKPKKNSVKGVNEYYAACSIRLPAQGKRPDADAGLLPARPVALTEKGLVVELIEQK
ncbi:MiaB/RimO family radical SAM methylthiotransferase [Desulfovibrio sp. UIB00]|uniref:MiaB/RimO family radical SAM methylthiotransferase n=1 Tax=Desulfovibrio sp. UIB00 TaxID=2804314 RepID=UPI001F0F1EDF|nr:radical SAM protein [Desulfovibrio sp. UIB00]MCH5145138.1 radical SAM protein [Desulfovibrio sp. UIB00]